MCVKPKVLDGQKSGIAASCGSPAGATRACGQSMNAGSPVGIPLRQALRRGRSLWYTVPKG